MPAVIPASMVFTPSIAFDPTDIARVAPGDLAALFAGLVADGRGLVLISGVDDDVLSQIDARLWSEQRYDPRRRLATALRFRCLVAAFQNARLRQLFLQSGHRLFAEIAHVAARQRLNVRRGFNPAIMHRALKRRLAEQARQEARVWATDNARRAA